ncbi:MAG: hypothetical protein JRH20_26205 [Deltaproteobacteria bacterium]|nr:hypothetical protein [Deltaproteobacteria bacterium]
MNTPDDFVQRAINDLATVRKAIETSGGDSHTRPDRVIIGANLTLQITAIVLATSILIWELVSGHLYSMFLNLSAHDSDLGISNIIIIGTMLLLLVAALYAVVFRASRKSKRDFSKFIARNFGYLKNLSLLSDLLIKFAVLALLIHVRQPQWVAPLLFAFIGDYLIQGRFFTITLRLSLLLGPLSFVCAAIQAYQGSVLLSWPLAGFILVCGISIAENLILTRSQPQNTSAAK